MTLDFSCFEGMDKHPGFGSVYGTYLLAEDACYDRDRTTRLRCFQTGAVVGPEIVKIPILM